MTPTAPQPPHPPPGRTRGRSGWVIPAVAAGAVVLAACCLGGVAIVATSDTAGDADDDQPGTAAAPSITTAGEPAGQPGDEDAPEPTATAEPEPEPEPDGFGAGIWEVGTEIPPGTYVTTAPDGGVLDTCYWARLSGFSGDFDELITNDNLNAGARGRLTIVDSDAGVELSGGCRWVEVSEAEPVEVGDRVGEGVWAVGDEVQPGTYTTTAPDGGVLDSCYWARLSGFSGGFDELITNGNVDAGARGRVEVAASDAGVQFNGDCTWNRS